MKISRYYEQFRKSIEYIIMNIQYIYIGDATCGSVHPGGKVGVL